MANLSKERRDRMIAKLEELKLAHNDDASIAALNEIENALREKKYGLVWEEHSEAVDDMLRENIPVLVADEERRLCRDPEMPWNFIIEGDNLQALYLLEKTHRGKVDCIYIDPPYNTGARDWKYNNDYVDGNDQYRHSKWLSMMQKRLLRAKHLLNPKDSILIVTIDQNELHHLACLLDELFPDAVRQTVTICITPSGASGDGLSRVEEFAIFVFIGNAKPAMLDDDFLLPDQDKKANSIRWESLMRGGQSWYRKERPNLCYPVVLSKDGTRIIGVGEPLPFHNDEELDIIEERNRMLIDDDGHPYAWPIRSDNRLGIWRVDAKRLIWLSQYGYIYVSSFDGARGSFTLRYILEGTVAEIEAGMIKCVGHGKRGEAILERKSAKLTIPKTIWMRSRHTAGGAAGTKLITDMLQKRNAFSFPKSLYAVEDSIKIAAINKPNSIIIDFFAGSGTTMHAVNLLNAEDGGHRRCIMVTNNEVSEAEAKSMKEKGLKPGDPEWEALGIARYVTWPRTVCSIEGHDINGNPLKGNYLGSDIPMADGFNANVKYFKCDWTPRKPEEYLLSNALCLHIKEMIELQTAREVDGEKVVLILSKEDYHRVFDDPAAAEKAQDVWVNENLFFNNAEMRVLRDKHFKYIPREFFSQELKEAGEYV